MISDDDWKNIKPKDIDLLGRRKFRDPEQAKQLEIFHILDLRLEWACQRLVVVNNLLIFLCALFILINGAQLLALYQGWITK